MIREMPSVHVEHIYFNERKEMIINMQGAGALIQWQHPEIRIKELLADHPHITNPMAAIVPTFFQIGYQKSGTTSSFGLLTQHQAYVDHGAGECVRKEPYFFNHILRDVGLNNKTVFEEYQKSYLVCLKVAAAREKKPVEYFFTVDATSNYFDLLPKSTWEERYSVAIVMRAYNPNAKLFLMLREPIRRTWSEYRFYSVEHPKMSSRVYSFCELKPNVSDAESSMGPDHFHLAVSQEIREYLVCLEAVQMGNIHLNYPINISVIQNDMRRAMLYCTFHVNVCPNGGPAKSIYAVYLMEWMRIWPSSQLHVDTIENMKLHGIKFTKTLFKFLGLAIPANYNFPTPYENQNIPTRKMKMHDATKSILQKFFDPYNKLLGDISGVNVTPWRYDI